MDRNKELRLIEDALSAVRRGAPPDLGPETKIDIECYLDPSAFAAEQTWFHRRNLNLVAHTSELPDPGSYITMDLAGVPVVIVRDIGDKQVRAFINVCRHRGARVALSQGRCKRLVCPYHAWTYRTDGRLDHVRHREGFPSLETESVSLTALPCIEHGSFIFVCPEPGGPSELDPALLTLIEEVEAWNPNMVVFARQTQVRKANWKLLVEGGIESYHFKIAHRSTIAKLFSDTASIYERVGTHLRSILPRASLSDLASQPAEHRRLLPHANILYTLNPNAAVLVQDGHYVLILMSPTAIDQTRIDLITVGRPVSEDSEQERIQSFLETNHAFTVKTLEEDFVMAEQIQAGLSSGANQTLRFATFESALRDWHQILDAALNRPTRLHT